MSEVIQFCFDHILFVEFALFTVNFLVAGYLAMGRWEARKAEFRRMLLISALFPLIFVIAAYVDFSGRFLFGVICVSEGIYLQAASRLRRTIRTPQTTPRPLVEWLLSGMVTAGLTLGFMVWSLMAG